HECCNRLAQLRQKSPKAGIVRGGRIFPSDLTSVAGRFDPPEHDALAREGALSGTRRQAAIGMDRLERVKGIEPSSSAWKAVALPLSYTRAREALHASPPSPTLRRVLFAIGRLAGRSAAGTTAGGGGRTRTYEG